MRRWRPALAAWHPQSLLGEVEEREQDATKSNVNYPAVHPAEGNGMGQRCTPCKNGASADRSKGEIKGLSYPPRSRLAERVTRKSGSRAAALRK